MPNIEDALALALKAHRDHVDRAGVPYILHPLRVMARMDTDMARMAALLHDVVEDSACTLDDLRADGYPAEVVRAVDALTHRAGETYPDYIARLQVDGLARRVKLADLEDNMDLRRLPTVQERDVQRLQRYRQAWGQLAALP